MNHTIKILFFVINMCCCQHIIAQEHVFKYPIHIDLNGRYVYSYNKTDSSVVTNVSSAESKPLKMISADSSGRLNIIFKDEPNNMIVKGSYIVINKIQKTIKRVRPIGRKEKWKDVDFYYYNARRTGTWFYYDNNGKLFKSVQYDKM